MKKTGILNQAKVKGNKYFLTRVGAFQDSYPSTPLVFATPKVQRQLELMVSITDYARVQDFVFMDEQMSLQPEVEPAEPDVVRRYRQGFRKLVLPAIRSVGEILNERMPGITRSKAGYLKLK